MGRTKSNIIELFIDKAVLAAAAIAALWILLAFVIGSPNSVKFNGEKIPPSKIDVTIRDEAENLQKKLQEKVQDGNQYKPQTSGYLALVENSVKIADANVNFPMPDYPANIGPGDRKYQLPKIGQIEKPSIAVVTMAAFVPTEELSNEVTYDKAEAKLEDIDLVTVESSINAKQLYDDFRSAFAGKNIPEEQKEEQYAKPVFAKVELQRRMLLEDGSWSQWTEVPRTKISQKKSLELPAQADEYGAQIALEQFAKSEVRDEVLQPPVYDNAIPVEKWICPPLYNERQKKIEKEKEEFKKQQLEAEKTKKLQDKVAPKRQPSVQPKTPPQSQRTPKSTPQTVTPHQVQPQKQPKPSAPAATENRQQPKTDEDQQFNELVLSEKTNPAGFEKLVFWAHDDTAVSGEKYQYRIRIGILNPIAGKPWFNEDQKDLQSQVVLFSNFSESDPNKPVEIPRHLYFFATDNRENEKGRFLDKTAEIKVARYTLGNWVTKTFSVKIGDKIGDVIEATGTSLEKAGIQADSIDLSTGNVMVDTRRATEWAGTGALRAKEFYELLYSKPGQDIQTMPIKERYWPEEIIKVYKEIDDAEAGEPTVLLTRFDARSGTHTKIGPARPAPAAAPGPETGPGTPPGGKTAPGPGVKTLPPTRRQN